MKIAVVYHFFPHYRAGIFKELTQSDRYNYVFVGSPHATDPSIKTWDPSSSGAEIIWTSIARWPLGARWQSGLFPVVASRDIKALIFLGDAHYISTWVFASLARLFGKKVFFWTHGWLRKNAGPREWLKDCFYYIANGLMLYGHHAERIALEHGYPRRKLVVIYNSLGTLPVEVSDAGTEGVRSALFKGHAPVVICTARLTPNCRFDLLIKAAAVLREKGSPINVLLVGDGPVRGELESLASRLRVDVCFYGACYNECELATLLYSADVLVSPGKVGLSAMHALAYGTPVISHDDFDSQMPEFEAIQPGMTGDFFAKEDVQDLAQKIRAWISRGDREAIRRACLNVINLRYNPKTQRALIERHLATVLGSE